MDLMDFNDGKLALMSAGRGVKTQEKAAARNGNKFEFDTRLWWR